MPARGRPKGSVVKPWQDALRRAVLEIGDGKEKKLHLLARKVVEAGLAGDMTAAKEIGDRLDGKPAQAIVGDDNADPVRMITEIRRTIIEKQS